MGRLMDIMLPGSIGLSSCMVADNSKLSEPKITHTHINILDFIN